MVIAISVAIAIALVAADGGLLLSLVHTDVKASVLISAISFAFYALTRVVPLVARWRRRASRPGRGGAPA